MIKASHCMSLNLATYSYFKRLCIHSIFAKYQVKQCFSGLTPCLSGRGERLKCPHHTFIEPRREKTNILHMRKQRRRSASR